MWAPVSSEGLPFCILFPFLMDCVLPEPPFLGCADYLGGGGGGGGGGVGGWQELEVGEPWCDLVMQKMLPPERHGGRKCFLLSQQVMVSRHNVFSLKYSLDGQRHLTWDTSTWAKLE